MLNKLKCCVFVSISVAFALIQLILFCIGMYNIDVAEDFLKTFGKCRISEIHTNLDCVNEKHRSKVLQLIEHHSTPNKIVFY